MTPAEWDNIQKFYEWAFSNATSKTNVAAADYLRRREELVQEVIRNHRNFVKLFAVPKARRDMVAMAKAGDLMRAALDKLAEWKP